MARAAADENGLTAQQAAFAREYARNGGRGADAAREAGFSEHSAGKYAYQLLEKPHVLKAVQAELRKSFTDLGALALGQARMMLTDPKTPASARVDLIKTVLDRAGLGVPKGAEEDPGDKPIRELSFAQLEMMAIRATVRPAEGPSPASAGPLLEGELAAPAVAVASQTGTAQAGE